MHVEKSGDGKRRERICCLCKCGGEIKENTCRKIRLFSLLFVYANRDIVAANECFLCKLSFYVFEIFIPSQLFRVFFLEN